MNPQDDTVQTPLPAAEEGRRRRRARTTQLDLRNTWGVIVGALLLPLGVAVILLGWNGAAHGRVEQQQLPYLISGGVLGLALVIVGCFFYWSHWLYRLYDQADLHHQESMQEQREMIAALLEALAAGERPAPVRSGTGSHRDTNGSGRTFVATPNGTNFHIPGCPMVVNRSDELRAVSEKEARSMKPCRVCDPVVHSGRTL